MLAWLVEEDTDGDGRLQRSYGQHGVPDGDAARYAYLYPDGERVSIDRYVAPTNDEVHLVEIEGELFEFSPATRVRRRILTLPSFRRDAWDGGHLAEVLQTPYGVVLETAPGVVELVDTDSGDRTELFRGRTHSILYEAGWVFIEFHSIATDDASPDSSAVRFVRTDPETGLSDCVGLCDGPEVGRAAIHLESGTRMTFGPRRLVGASWGLISLDRAGSLVVHPLNASATRVAEGCRRHAAIVAAADHPRLVFACPGRRFETWQLGGEVTGMSVRPLPRLHPEEAERLGIQEMSDVFVRTECMRGSGGFSICDGESVLVDWSRGVVWRELPPAASRDHPLSFVQEGESLYFDPESSTWRRVRAPLAEERVRDGCLRARNLHPTLWDRCVRIPADTTLASPVDSRGRALLRRLPTTEHRSGFDAECANGLGSVLPGQLVWGRLALPPAPQAVAATRR